MPLLHSRQQKDSIRLMVFPESLRLFLRSSGKKFSNNSSQNHEQNLLDDQVELLHDEEMVEIQTKNLFQIQDEDKADLPNDLKLRDYQKLSLNEL